MNDNTQNESRPAAPNQDSGARVAESKTPEAKTAPQEQHENSAKLTNDQTNAPGKEHSGQVGAVVPKVQKEPTGEQPKFTSAQDEGQNDKRGRASREIAVILVAIVAAVISLWQAQEARKARIEAGQARIDAGNDAQRAEAISSKLEADANSGAKAQQTSAETQREALDLTGRPYVGMIGIAVLYEDIYTIAIKAVGTTPALHVRIWAGCEEQKRIGHDQDKQKAVTKDLLLAGGQILPDSVLNIRFACRASPEELTKVPTTKATPPPGTRRTDDSEESLIQRPLHFFLVGKIQYDDIRRNRHYTNFCDEVYVNPDRELVVNTCLVGNESN